MKNIAILAVVVLAVSTSLASDRAPGAGSAERRKGAATPKEAVAKFADAIRAMDKNAMIACCSGSKTEMRIVEIMADFGQAVLEFKKKFIKAYGEQAWKDFQDPNKKLDAGNARFMLPSGADLEAAKKQKITMEKDGTATFEQVGSTQQGKLVKVNGSWFVDAKSLLPPNARPEDFIKMMTAFTALVGKYQKAIGHDGVSGEDIDVELGRAMVKLLLGFRTDQPHRFDIDKIASGK